MKYGVPLDHTDAVTLAHDSQFDILAPYVALKLFDTQPEAQKEVLQEVVTALTRGQRMAETLTALFRGVSPETYTAVDPNKLSRVSLWSPAVIRSSAQEVMHQTQQNHETPVLIGYSGLLALETAIKKLFEGKPAMVVLPNKISSQQPIGYLLRKNQDSTSVEYLLDQHRKDQAKVALIDDTVNTGATFKRVAGVFPSSEVRNAPLFMTTRE